MSTERCDVSLGSAAVILDYGQVLARCPTAPEFGRMAKMFNVSFELFCELWEASRGTYDRGFYPGRILVEVSGTNQHFAR